jgi:biofilm PGA synthesis lipoprotein PgaB
MRIVLLAALALLSSSALAEDGRFDVLAYHDVRDTVAGDFDPDQYAVATATLIDHFTWLRLNGFTPVSVDDLIAAQRGVRPLPDKSVLLTFDDGRRSFYTHVFPLLKLFNYPAVANIVTSWIETDPGVVDGGRTLTRDDFLTWEQVREIAASGLVEIASHSHALHKGIRGNPQGNEEPAAVTLGYDGEHYESDAAYRARIAADLAQSVRLIEQHAGRAPRVIAWPFGAYNSAAREIAAEHGLRLGLTLSDGINHVDALGAMPRHLIEANAGVDDLGYALLNPPPAPLVRAAQVDLDYVYDPDPAQQEENLSLLLDRIKALEITHVFLQAFADPDADGGAQALYFPSERLPMRADLFNRAAWQLKTRADVLVYAWLPLLSYSGDGIDPAWRVQQRVGSAPTDEGSEPRLSPFEPDAVAVIRDIYRDLARHASFDGVLFHDDGRFNALEDASPAAMRAYRARFGEDFSFAKLAADPALRAEWGAFRSEKLVALSQDLTEVVREYRPAAKTARNLFATAILAPDGHVELAQGYKEFLAAYDYVALMAMPALEDVPHAEPFYSDLARAVRAVGGFDKTIFELQTIDWRTGERVPAPALRDTMRMLQALGVRNLAYYPDDFIEGHPALAPLREGISVAVYPRGAPP